jgi:adenylate cyclase
MLQWLWGGLDHARETAILRYLFEDCVLDADKRELHRGGNAISVTPQVFDLLLYLVRNRQRVASKDDLIAAIWEGRIVSDAALTTRINVARGAIGDNGEEQRLLKTLPRKGFRFVGAVREEHGPPADVAVTGTTGEPSRSGLALPDKPSIAVLPFANLNADPEQEYFADGIVGDIITELSRFSELFVIARNSSFQYKGRAVDVRQVGRELGVRYLLEGSIRRSGDRIRISAQLIDTATGVHRWAENYDRKLEDVFAVQDDVVRTIAALLAAHVRKAETERTRGNPPNSWQAYDYYLQAVESQVSFSFSFRLEDLYEARRLLQQSLSVDANYARSYALLSRTHAVAWMTPLDSDYLNSAALDLAHQCAHKASQLDPNLPEGRAALGFVLAYMRQYDASLAEIERAFALNPNYVEWRLGLALVAAGRARRAVDVLEASMRLDPFYSPAASSALGLAHYMLKQYEQALPALRDCVARAPNLRAGHSWLAATYAQLGRMDEARAEAAAALRIQPNYSIAQTTRGALALRSPEDGEHLFDGLRKAGLPE